jgi:hypothetical protein
MYEYMAGIVPTSPGYRTVDVKPHISKTLGPASVGAVVRTVRGSISSNWTRHTIAAAASAQDVKGQTVLSLEVQIPAGVERATVRIPLLGLAARRVHMNLLVAQSTPLATPGTASGKASIALWHGGALPKSRPGTFACEAVVGADGDDALELRLGPGTFEFAVVPL